MHRSILTAVILFEVGISSLLIVHIYRGLYFPRGNEYKLDIIKLNRSWYSTQRAIIPGYYEPIAFHHMYQEPKTWMKEPIIYTINGDTLNERYDYTIQKPSNTFRIVTLGDSFTFGMYVNTYQNWPEQLEDMVNRLDLGEPKRNEVINLGVPGYDIEFEVARFMDRGEKYSPDLLIWHLISNDFNSRASFIFTESPKMLTTMEQQGLKGRELLQRAHHAVMDTQFRMYGGEDAVVSYQLAQLQSLLQSLPDTRVLILLDSGIDSEIVQKVKQITSIYSNIDVSLLPVIDILPDTHPSPIGHKQIATRVYMYLRQARFVL